MTYARTGETFFSPFETMKDWRWYWRFLRQYPTGMALRCEADCYAALGYDGLVMA